MRGGRGGARPRELRSKPSAEPRPVPTRRGEAVVRWGMIGCGDVCERKSGPALQQAEGSELLAVTRRDFRRAQDYAQRHGVPRVYPSVEDLLADRSVNAVYIATPPDSHEALTLQAAAAGKHVLVEKPMALNAEQCRRMVEACAANGVVLAVAYYRRFFPLVERLRELLREGAIGNERHARLTLTFAGRPELMSAQPPSLRPWRLIPAVAGGGQLVDVGSHRIDLLRDLFGGVAEASAWIAPHPEDEVETTMVGRLVFRSDIPVQILVDQEVSFPEDSLEIHGSRGRLTARPFDTTLVLQNAAGRKTFSFDPPMPTHTRLVEDFVHCVRTGSTPLVSGEEGLATTAVLDALYRSAREGRAVAPAS